METPLQRPECELVASGRCSITNPPVRRERRKMFRRLNSCAVPGYAPLCMDSNDPDTVKCSYMKRLLRDIPKPDPSFLTEFRIFVQSYLDENVPSVQPMGFEEWLDSTSYNEQRKEQLRQAHLDLRGGRPSRRAASHVDSFVKSEFYTEWKHARMINSRSDSFKAYSGPFFKAIENAVYSLPEFIKHTPVADRPAAVLALKQAGRRYYQTDFTAFESHFTPEVLDNCECLLYAHCLKNYPADAAFINSTLMGNNRMRTRSGIATTVRGRRMSGDMCTSLGNGFTNLMLAKFITSRKGGMLVGFVEGDDGLFATDVPLSQSDYERLGWTIKIDEVDDPCTASFCGMVFAESGQIIKDPRKFMMGFGWTQSFLHAGPKIMDELLRAKAMSAVCETPQCPIIGAIARYALAHTQGSTPRFVHDGYHTPIGTDWEPNDYNPSHDTRLLFEKLYGITVDEQIRCEELATQGKFGEISQIVPPTPAQLEYSTKYVVAT